MDDVTFLRNFARQGRVVLLAGGVAVPLPTSVMDDETLAGATFRISLVSPEGAESGDRRTFQPGTITWRELPLPLLWQWELGDGHKNAVVVGRIDYIERTPDGLGNARGVFDTGPWGREAERMVRAGMLRGVSGDYSKFVADVVEKSDPEDDRLIDDKLTVIRSQLVAATIVAKPAFEDCYIEILDEDQLLPDGIIEAVFPITAAASLRASGQHALIERLERLESLEREQLALTASAVTERVNAYRLERDRKLAIARIRGAQNITAAWKPMDSKFLSAKAKLQPRDSKGRWIEMGSIVRWHGGSERVSGVPKGGNGGHKDTPFRQGHVKSFDPVSGEYTIDPLDDSPSVKLKGSDVEVVKAVIPSSPTEAQKLNADLDAATQNLIKGTDDNLGGGKTFSMRIDGLEADDSMPPEVKTGLDQLNDLLDEGSGLDDPNVESARQARKREASEAKDLAQQAEDARLWPPREDMARQMLNNIGRPNETWEKDGEKYMRAADRLKKIGDSRLVSKKRRGWIQNTYGKDAEPIAPTGNTYSMKLDDGTTPSFNAKLSGLSEANAGNEVGPLAKALVGIPEADPSAPDAPDAHSTPDTPSAPETPTPDAPEAPDAPPPAGQDAVKVMGQALAEMIKSLRDPPTPPGQIGTIRGNNADKPDWVGTAPKADDTPAMQQPSQGEIDAQLYDAQHAPAGNFTVLAKTMFQNLHPDLDWDTADQATWINAAQKAQETKNDA